MDLQRPAARSGRFNLKPVGCGE